MSPEHEALHRSAFRCPRCLGSLQPGTDHLACRVCDIRYTLRDGIPDLRVHRFDYYFNPVPRPEMDVLVREAASVPWDATVRRFLQFVKNVPDWIDNVTVNGRYAWKLFLELPPRGRFLDLGCGLGNLSANVAPHVGEVVALDLTWERLLFAQQRFARNGGGSNVTLVAGGDGPHLPFPDGHFDAIALSGVLEWIADDIDASAFRGARLRRAMAMLMSFFGERNPRRTQIRFLRELARILKPEGQLFVAIENRWGYEYFLGRPDHHSGIPAGSLLPRLAANAWSIVHSRRPYRTYTHTYWGLRRLMRAAGLARHAMIGLAPGYSGLAEIVPLGTQRAYWQPAPREGFAARIKHSDTFVPAFGIVAQRTADRRPAFVERLLDHVGEQSGLRGLVISDCRVTGKDKVVLSASAAGTEVVLKLPSNPAALAGESHHHRTIAALAQRADLADVVPVPVAHGTFQGVAWFCERRMRGVPAHAAVTRGRDTTTRAVAAFVEHLARVRSAPVALDPHGTMAQWLIDEPLRRLAALAVGGEVLDSIGGTLRRVLASSRWSTGLMHGDLSVSNVFVDGAAIRGAIDWEHAREDGLPALDLIAWMESAQRAADPHSNVGANLLRLAGDDWTSADELATLRALYATLGVDAALHRSLCLLALLQHASHQLDTVARFDPRIVARLVDPWREALGSVA